MVAAAAAAAAGAGSYDKQYSSGHKFSITILVFAVTIPRDFEQVISATFDSQNGDFQAIW